MALTSILRNVAKLRQLRSDRWTGRCRCASSSVRTDGYANSGTIVRAGRSWRAAAPRGVAVIVSAVVASVHATPGAAAEPTTCAAGSAEQTLAESFGSVAFMPNLRNSAGSVSAVAEELLGRALDSSTWPESACPDGCDLAGRQVVYKVMPTVYIEKTRQRPECLRLESETSEQPLRFGSRRFATIEEMTKWIMTFSRGKGDDGKALYRECSSNCSPRYTFLIRNGDGGGFVLEPEVVCGLARDKDSTHYSLTTSLRTSCGSPPLAADTGS